MEHNTFWCKHPQTRLAYKTCSNGAIFYYQQCIFCFEQVTDWINKKSLGNKILSAVDENQDGNGLVYPKTDAEWKRHKDNLKKFGDGKYQNYLKSNEWAKISRLCLQRDKYTCKAKLRGCIGRANQAHHLTYDNVYHEKLEDLMSVCGPCHDKITRDKIDLRAKWMVM
jgi:hypothetical protein